MKVCLMGGSPSGRMDEGMQNITHRFGVELSKRHEVRTVAVGFSSLIRCGRLLASFQPDIIHYLPGPSILSLVILKLTGRFSPRSKTVASALHPWFPLRSDAGIRLLRPDRVLVQSRTTERLFQTRGCRTAFLPNGVDLAKFQPVPREIKKAWRAGFGLAQEEFIILHVGAVKSGRGMGLCRILQSEDQRMLVVGSVSTGYEPPVLKDLESRGCLVWIKYMPDIEKVYGIADCYVFPVRDSLHSIETPLSVLEAMAANLPVVTTRFGALPDAFPEGDGLIYADTPGDFADAVRRIREKAIPVRTRERVMDLSWENITARLEEIYSGVAGEGGLV